MKDEIGRKAVTGTAIIDEEAKKELIQKGRDQERAWTVKMLTASESPSP